MINMEERLKNIMISLLKGGDKYLNKNTSNPFYLHYNTPSEVIISRLTYNQSHPIFNIHYANSTETINNLTKIELYTCDELFSNIVKQLKEEVISNIESELNSNPPEDSLDEIF